MISVIDLTKRFGAKVAVDHLTFDVRPGVVTGFLGPNGSGKSTTMRCMLGLDLPDGGSTSFQGRRYRDLAQPLHEVGALLDAGYVHPGRSARNHLRWLAASNGIARGRVDEVLELVGLTTVAAGRLRSYSLGMRQRLGLAAVLLGDPQTASSPYLPSNPQACWDWWSYVNHEDSYVTKSGSQIKTIKAMLDARNA